METGEVFTGVELRTTDVYTIESTVLEKSTTLILFLELQELIE